MPFVKVDIQKKIRKRCKTSPKFKKGLESRKNAIFHRSYTTYTNELCHQLNELGDIEFINNILDMVDIEVLLEFGYKKHALYTVAFIDHVCKKNNLPLKPELDKYRRMNDLFCYWCVFKI